MAKAKKAKLVQVREPNGRLSRSTADAVKACSPAEVKRLRDAALQGMQDEVWGTEVGRLYLDGKLDAIQLEAGKRWGRLAFRAAKAIGAPGYPGAAVFGQRIKSHDPDPDSDEGRERAAADRMIVQEMMEALAALSGAGKAAVEAVRHTCEENKAPVGYMGLVHLERGLSWIAAYWGLTTQQKNVRNVA